MDTPYTVELMPDQARTLARFAEYDGNSPEDELVRLFVNGIGTTCRHLRRFRRSRVAARHAALEAAKPELPGSKHAALADFLRRNTRRAGHDVIVRHPLHRFDPSGFRPNRCSGSASSRSPPRLVLTHLSLRCRGAC